MTRAGSRGYQAWLAGAGGARLRDLPARTSTGSLELTHEYVACHEPDDDPVRRRCSTTTSRG